MKVFIYGLAYEGEEPEADARMECEAEWGTAEDCLVVDVAGRVLLNTTSTEVEEVYAT